MYHLAESSGIGSITAETDHAAWIAPSGAVRVCRWLGSVQLPPQGWSKVTVAPELAPDEKLLVKVFPKIKMPKPTFPGMDWFAINEYLGRESVYFSYLIFINSLGSSNSCHYFYSNLFNCKRVVTIS